MFVGILNGDGAFHNAMYGAFHEMFLDSGDLCEMSWFEIWLLTFKWGIIVKLEIESVL